MSIRSLYFLYFFSCLAVSIVAFPSGLSAVLVSGLFSIPAILVLRKTGDDASNLLKIFLTAIILRTFVSASIDFFDATAFFALDWKLYDQIGFELAEYLTGDSPPSNLVRNRVLSFRGTAWGISTLVGSVYMLAGRNLLAAQLVITVFGAATAPLAYLCAYQMYGNKRVALLSGYIVALAPSFILWSSLVLKDGLIIFFLVLTMYASLKLQQKLDLASFALLLIGLIGIMSMRYYVFYITVVAVAGGFFIGQKTTVSSVLTRAGATVLLGFTLGYLGILSNAQFELEQMTSLETIQISRQDLARSAASGFGQDYDVSTVGGSLAVLPIGFAYLMLAPFPWQITSTLSLAALPETLAWWVMMVPLIAGIVYSVRHRLRKSISVLVFTLMLTLGYSVLQGNVGTAYRHRAQIQVFLFIFIAVGWSLYKERKEDEKLLQASRRNHFEKALQARLYRNS